MLERLNQILERLDSFGQYLPNHATPEAVPAVDFQPAPDSRILHSPHAGYDADPADLSDREYMTIPSSRTTSDTILSWPIFENRYPPNFLVQSLYHSEVDVDSDDEFELDSETSNHRQRSRGGNILPSGGVEENVLRLIDNFLAVVHTKNPILDVMTLKKYARRVAEDGPGWDGQSCLVVSLPYISIFPLYFPGLDIFTYVCGTHMLGSFFNNLPTVNRRRPLRILRGKNLNLPTGCRKLSTRFHQTLFLMWPLSLYRGNPRRLFPSVI
jgi:hypothetical protein